MEVSNFEPLPGATPLVAEDIDGLKLSWITNQGELNEAEAENIVRGPGWAFRRRRPKFWYLADGGLEAVHVHMLGDVWAWAGEHRRRETNIGIHPVQIRLALCDLQQNTLAQIGDGTSLAYPTDELAVRYHHALVSIHPFRNGNGRHSRLLADLLVADVGGVPFSWGGSDITSISVLRSRYLAALRRADTESDFHDLIEFARRGQ
jgi:Fic-DOC domain mobile mystery protein B